jgi:hypothetical protein
METWNTIRHVVNETRQSGENMTQLINRWEVEPSEEYPGLFELCGESGDLRRFYMVTTPCGRICLRETDGGNMEDNRDYCLMCDAEIPPGPDFCSDECEERARKITKERATTPSSETEIPDEIIEEIDQVIMDGPR